eukprot:19030-Heterococcus_DN1.PRE.1
MANASIVTADCLCQQRTYCGHSSHECTVQATYSCSTVAVKQKAKTAQTDVTSRFATSLCHVAVLKTDTCWQVHPTERRMAVYTLIDALRWHSL